MKSKKTYTEHYKECINNVKKHADTNKMDLTLKQMNDILYIDVIDYGQGFGDR